MTVKYFSCRIEGTDNTKLENIKSWIETKIDNADLNILGGTGVMLSYDDLTGSYELSWNMFIKANKSILKYINYVKDAWTSLDKTGITYAVILRNDNCSHDSSDPQPDVVSVVWEYNGDA